MYYLGVKEWDDSWVRGSMKKLGWVDRGFAEGAC